MESHARRRKSSHEAQRRPTEHDERTHVARAKEIRALRSEQQTFRKCSLTPYLGTTDHTLMTS